MFFVAYASGNSGVAAWTVQSVDGQVGIVNLSGNYAPLAHNLNGANHNGISGVEDNFMSLDASGLPKDSGFADSDFEPAIGAKGSAFNKDFGAISDTVCEGDDSRLSDARTPTAHDLDGAEHNGISGTENNFMALDASGKPKDSGSKASDFSLLEQVVVKSSGVSAALTDAQKNVEYQNSTNAYTFTIEPDSTTDFPIGSWMIISKTGTGDITIARGTGVTFRGQSGDVNIKVDGEDGFSVYISKRSANTWMYSGAYKDV